METFTWTGQRTDASTTTCGATDKFGFYGSAFNDAIETAAYQDTTHVENSSNADQCTTNHVHNTKYVSSSNVDIDDGGSEALGAGAPTAAECPLKLNFSHGSSVATSDATFWAYDGTTDATGPVDVTFQCGEQADTAWTAADGSGSALALDDNTTATSHDFFIFMSASPDTVGVKTDFALKIQLTYQ